MIKVKPTYEELENQIAELKKQNEIIRLNSYFQNFKKEKIVDELITAKEEKIKRADELIVAKEKKQKRANEYEILSKNLKHEKKEKTKREAELNITNKKLLNSIQLNIDKDSFISILAHDLKNPFSSILGFLDLLLDNIRTYDIDSIEEQLKIVNKSAINTFALLEDILMWVRASSGKIPYLPQNLNFTLICNKVVENLSLTANAKNITINYFSATEIHVFADENMLKTILRNLISNAIKYTNKDGHIDIYGEQNTSTVIMSVADNGIGIEQDAINELFDIAKDVSTKGTENESGTGLGLLLCKEFIEMHGGKIWVESELGNGSKFNLTLPLYEH